MKKSVSLILVVLFFYGAKSQTLFTYGKNQVSVSEFLNAYNKNKTETNDKEKALREYLDLFIVFKLKVQAAKDDGLDQLPALQADLKNFRSQIEENYLKNDAQVNKLVDEAFERSQKDIHVLHYYIDLPANSDSTEILKYVKDFKKQLVSAKKPVQSLIAEAQGIVVEESDLGFVTVFTLPYNFENIIYNLKKGEYSEPYRTNNGWHIFKKVEERKAKGKMKLAQILIAAPDGVNSVRTDAKSLADSLYRLLQSGGDFSELAKQYSNDRTSFMNGGELPEFGVGRYAPDFEKKAFSLQSDGEILPPFETHFGFHIIKLLSATPVPASLTDEIFRYQLREQVLKDSRIQLAAEQFIKDILPKTGFNENKISVADLWKVTDTSILINKNITSGNINEETVLFSFNNDQPVKVKDWILYVRNSGDVLPGRLHDLYNRLWSDFKSYVVKENYRNRLEDFDPEFKSQLAEFREGNMLFEIMEKNVWGKAASDSAGLLSYYEQYREKYKWEASADAVLFACANENVANTIIKNLNDGQQWNSIEAENPTLVQADSGRFELGQIPVVDRTNFTPGLITRPVINNTDRTAVFAKIITVYNGGEQRKFEDARGLVISDYQNVLEKNWIEKLKEKYPIKINEKAFRAILK